MKYRPDPSLCLHYYQKQAGGGGGGGDIPIFVGSRFQRGHGLGNVFGSLFRWAKPILKKVAFMAGKQALASGSKILEDVQSGKDFKESAKSRFGEAIRNTISGQAGSGLLAKRRFPFPTNSFLGKQSIRQVVKRRKRSNNKKQQQRGRDIFD